MWRLLICLTISPSVIAAESPVYVKYIVVPSYVSLARSARLQGTVSLELEIDHDGKVLKAKGSGAHPLLIKEAEQNVRLWTFGFLQRSAEFPLHHKMDYIFRLEGDERYHDPPPRVVLVLPYRVEITSHPPQVMPQAK